MRASVPPFSRSDDLRDVVRTDMSLVGQFFIFGVGDPDDPLVDVFIVFPKPDRWQPKVIGRLAHAP